jgi:two-component sensor histidine kinase
VLEVHDDGEGRTPARPGTEPGPPEGERSLAANRAQPAVHSPGGSGSGLGLRLVRALVDEELGGQFTLAIRPGKGSLATATIPGKE